jgi:hypothetical protein
MGDDFRPYCSRLGLALCEVPFRTMRIRKRFCAALLLLIGCHRAPTGAASSASSTAVASAEPSFVSSAQASASTSPRPQRPPLAQAQLDPEHVMLQRVMSCFSEKEPTVCPWWESVLDTGGYEKTVAACNAGQKNACLTAGLHAMGAGSFDDAAVRIEKACASDEPLACVYLAAAHFACVRPSEGQRPACKPAFESHYDDPHAQAVLEQACEGGLGSACSALGEVVWTREDNRFPWLERACRYGIMDACETLYKEAHSLTSPPNPRGVGWMRIRIMEICDEQPIDCFSAATELAEFTHTPSRRFVDRACDMQKIPHMPRATCDVAKKNTPATPGSAAFGSPQPASRNP